MSRWVVILSSQSTVKVLFFFSSLFHSFLSEPGGQPAGRQGCREVFSSSTWVRETDGACQTVVCGFIQIYDGRKSGWMWAGESRGADGRQEDQLSMQDSERLEVCGWGGGPITVVLLFELIVFYFSALLCVLLFCQERPCLHIELHYIPPRTQSCLSHCLIGICLGSSTAKATCFISR